jgi:SAM-dependent methyltransferase
MSYFDANLDEQALEGEIPGQLEAFCYVCQGTQLFDIENASEEVNWRETLRCEGCGLINRWRSSVHLFEALCKPNDESPIYITEAITPLYQMLKQRYPETVGSEYVEGRESGEVFEAWGHKVQFEDVTRLSFRAGCFDAILSFDVLEHVPDYKQALKEFLRVLKPGGIVLWSAPFSFAEQTEIRASLLVDGTIEHHLPPHYHGDPMSDQGVLCFQSFGVDVLHTMESMGFVNARVCAFSDRAHAYLDRNILFVAEKPGSLHAPRRSVRRWLSRNSTN